MQKILEKMYLDRLAFGKFTKNSEYAKIMCTLAEQEKKLMEIVQDNPLLASFTQAQRELSLLSETEAFVSGFRLGAKIMLEVMEDHDGCFSGAADQ